jgi:hypothetical protein
MARELRVERVMWVDWQTWPTDHCPLDYRVRTEPETTTMMDVVVEKLVVFARHLRPNQRH